MPDFGAEARIQDLKRRVDQDPGSRLFVALAEEYRKSGRFAEALSTLQRGLLAHPSYLSAQVALGRAYLEAGQVTEAIATFSKVLATDPGNLVSAKALADVYLSRGERVEAVKKYKLYRALSGDRAVDDIIGRLDKELAPPPPPPRAAPAVAVPPPPAFAPAADKTRESAAADAARARRSPLEEPFDLSPVSFDDAVTPPPSAGEPFPLGPRPTAPFPELATGAGALKEAAAEWSVRERVEPPPAPARSGGGSDGQGRTLADLYFAQGHYSEALRIYDELVAANPFDEELRRLRRDSEARLLPASASDAASSTTDPAFDRRLKKIRSLRQWLSVLQAG